MIDAEAALLKDVRFVAAKGNRAPSEARKVLNHLKLCGVGQFIVRYLKRCIEVDKAHQGQE